MNTLLTIKEQNAFLSDNWTLAKISHRWSTRGYGNSKIFDDNGCLISHATGCGYDRLGKAFGEFIQQIFSAEIQKLGKKATIGRGKNKRVKREFYGLNLNRSGKYYLDGACGLDCMLFILACIGFSLVQVGSVENSNNGQTFYILTPVDRDSWVFNKVKEVK